jgi:hypothetical protein
MMGLFNIPRRREQDKKAYEKLTDPTEHLPEQNPLKCRDKPAYS